MRLQAAVDAIADGDVDEAILAGDRHGGLAAVLGERIQAGAAAAAEDETENIFHGETFAVGSGRMVGKEALEICYHTLWRDGKEDCV